MFNALCSVKTHQIWVTACSCAFVNSGCTAENFISSYDSSISLLWYKKKKQSPNIRSLSLKYKICWSFNVFILIILKGRNYPATRIKPIKSLMILKDLENPFIKIHVWQITQIMHVWRAIVWVKIILCNQEFELRFKIFVAFPRLLNILSSICSMLNSVLNVSSISSYGIKYRFNNKCSTWWLWTFRAERVKGFPRTMHVQHQDGILTTLKNICF